jgi:hypothetical protein
MSSVVSRTSQNLRFKNQFQNHSNSTKKLLNIYKNIKFPNLVFWISFWVVKWVGKSTYGVYVCPDLKLHPIFSRNKSRVVSFRKLIVIQIERSDWSVPKFGVAWVRILLENINRFESFIFFFDRFQTIPQKMPGKSNIKKQSNLGRRRKPKLCKFLVPQHKSTSFF